MSLDWKAIVKTAAPFLGTALLGGPLGLAAGKLVAVALGSDETKATPDDLAKLVQSVTPEQLLALKQADQAFQIQLKEIGINEVKDLEALAVQDRSSARDMAVKTGDKTPRILAIGITLGFFGLLTYLLRHEPPAGSRDILNIMLGSLGSAWIGVTSYYFGSSAGSDRKSDLLAQAPSISESK